VTPAPSAFGLCVCARCVVQPQDAALPLPLPAPCPAPRLPRPLVTIQNSRQSRPISKPESNCCQRMAEDFACVRPRPLSMARGQWGGRPCPPVILARVAAAREESRSFASWQPADSGFLARARHTRGNDNQGHRAEHKMRDQFRVKSFAEPQNSVFLSEGVLHNFRADIQSRNRILNRARNSALHKDPHLHAFPRRARRQKPRPGYAKLSCPEERSTRLACAPKSSNRP